MSLKIGMAVDPPMCFPCALDPKCSSPGYAVDFAKFFCNALNLTCTFVWSPTAEYGDALENGTGTGIIGLIQRGELDTVIPILTPTFNRSMAISFGYPLFYNKIILWTKAPQISENNLNWSVVYAFQWPIWFVFILIWLLTSYLIKETAPEGERITFFDMCMQLLKKESRYQILLKPSRIRLIYGSWLLAANVLALSYTSILFSQSVLIQGQLPFTDLETFVQCLEKKQCRIITHTMTASFVQQYVYASDEYGQRIRNSLKENPILMAESYSSIKDKILENRNQYLVNIGSKITRMTLIDQNRDCLFYTVEMSYGEYNAFGFAKNSSYLKKFNAVQEEFVEKLLSRRWMKKYKDHALCEEDFAKGHRSKPWLNKGNVLRSMITTFCFFGLGMCIAFVAFVTEMIVFEFWSSAMNCVPSIARV